MTEDQDSADHIVDAVEGVRAEIKHALVALD